MKKRKLLSAFLCAAMLAGCSGSSTAAATTTPVSIPDGVYEGTGTGNNGPISVSVTVKDNKLTDVEVTSNTETQGIGDVAVAKVPQDMVDNNTFSVDNVSGATVTTVGIESACRDALKDVDPDGTAFNTDVETEKDSETREMSADIVVIGAGGGGMAAATKAASMGKSVILIEKNDMVGGDTMCNAGTLIATGSKFQKEKLGEENDSPELAYDDIMRIGLNKNDPVLVKMITETIGSTVDWLIDDMKVPYDVAQTQYPDHSAKRQIGVVGRSYEFFKVMTDNFENLGGQLLLGTKATKLLTDDSGAVTGVECEDSKGKIDITAKTTIDAAGGFGANTKMLPDSLNGYMFYGRTTDLGDGLNLGTDVGADTINLDLVKVYHTIDHASSTDPVVQHPSSCLMVGRIIAVALERCDRSAIDPDAQTMCLVDHILVSSDDIGRCLLTIPGRAKVVDSLEEDDVLHTSLLQAVTVEAIDSRRT